MVPVYIYSVSVAVCFSVLKEGKNDSYYLNQYYELYFGTFLLTVCVGWVTSGLHFSKSFFVFLGTSHAYFMIFYSPFQSFIYSFLL